MRYILATQQSMTIDEMAGNVEKASDMINRKISEIYAEAENHNYSYLDSRFLRNLTFMICGVKFDAIIDKGQVVISSGDELVMSAPFEDVSRESVSKAIKEYCYNVLNIGGLIRTSALNAKHELTAYTEDEFDTQLANEYRSEIHGEPDNFLVIIRHEDDLNSCVCHISYQASFRDSLDDIRNFVEAVAEGISAAQIAGEGSYFYSVVEMGTGNEQKCGTLELTIEPDAIAEYEASETATIRDIDGGIF